MKVRTRIQPTVEVEVDEGERRVLEHQGLLWSGTDQELAALCEAAGLPAPVSAAPAKTASAIPAGAATATTTTGKES